MKKTVFVPLTDDFLYEYPERILGPVIPFSQQGRRASVDSPSVVTTIRDRDFKTNSRKKSPSMGYHSKRY